MQALGDSLGVRGELDFRGIIGNDDVLAMFREADIVAVPSRTAYPEGFPLTMFEALASRSPIVGTDHPMFRPVLTNGSNCCAFPSGDVEGFAGALRRVLGSTPLDRQLSESALETWTALNGLRIGAHCSLSGLRRESLPRGLPIICCTSTRFKRGHSRRTHAPNLIQPKRYRTGLRRVL